MIRGTLAAQILIAFTFTVVGCGSSRHAPAQGQDAGAEGGLRPGVPHSGLVYEGVIGPDGGLVPIAGAKVCVVDHPEVGCATTDSDGKYTMSRVAVDAGTRWAVNFTAEGHLGSTIAPDGFWPEGVELKSDAWATTMAAQAGFTYPGNGTAFVRLRVALGGQGVAGATAALSPPSGVGPIYVDESGNPAPALTSTSSSGLVLFGNVTPGLFTVAISSPGKTCDCCDHGMLTGWEWTGPAPGSFVAVAASDSLTDNLYMQCY